MIPDKIVYDVDLVSDLRSLILNNSDVTFDDAALRTRIFNLDTSLLVKVGKKISSLKIVSVDVIDDDFINSAFSD